MLSPDQAENCIASWRTFVANYYEQAEQIASLTAERDADKELSRQWYGALTNASAEHGRLTNELRIANEALAEQRVAICELVAEFGCTGPCEHGPCNVEKECTECKLDIDTWCLTCRIEVLTHSAHTGE